MGSLLPFAVVEGANAAKRLLSHTVSICFATAANVSNPPEEAEPSERLM
jgi:hypothetical protein